MKRKSIFLLVTILGLGLAGCFDADLQLTLDDKAGKGSFLTKIITDIPIPQDSSTQNDECILSPTPKSKLVVENEKTIRLSSVNFNSLDELKLRLGKVSLKNIEKGWFSETNRVEIQLAPSFFREKDKNEKQSPEEAAMVAAMLKGHFFTTRINLPSKPKKAYPGKLGEKVTITPDISENSVTWKIPMVTFVTCGWEKEDIPAVFRIDF